MTSDETDGLWLFGYGSLIWKPPPHFGVYRGTLTAMYGAFGSEDHRGTPEAPGRVVTLIERSFWEKLHDSHPDSTPHVWGAAYHIPPPKVAEVREYLDIREINGYSMRHTPFHPSPEAESGDASSPADTALKQPISCLVYIGLPENPQFLGAQDPEELAAHILRSRGPSGENRDYLYQLDEALMGLSEWSRDEHVHDLARRCKRMEEEEGGMKGRRFQDLEKEGEVLGGRLRKVGSTEEQEEVEK